MEDLGTLFQSLITTDVTKTTHRDTYPAISSSRPELRQTGRTVLITGGGTGVGFSIARSFIRASAHTVIVIGRRSDVLASASAILQQEAKSAGTNTRVITYSCDVVNKAEVEALWDGFAAQGITIDVFVANAAKFSEPNTIFELGADEVWSQIEVNAKAPLYFAEKFYAQKGDKQKFIVNVSSQAASMTDHAGVAARPAYVLSKMTGTVLFQVIAQNVSPEKLQVINFHPGVIYNSTWEKMGIPRELFDHDDLCGDFAVWATTKEAEFLHGRYVWASWDVQELSTGEIRKRIDDDFYFLRATVSGLNGAFLA